MESFLFYTILVLMALFLLAWGNSFGGRHRELHLFLPGRGALLLYEHFVEKGVIFASYFHPFLSKRIALLLYEHFFQKGVIIWIPESPKTLNLLSIDDFVQKGVIFA